MLSEEEKAISRLNLLNKELYIDDWNLVNYKDLKIVLNLVNKLKKENETKIIGFENEELNCSKFIEKVGKNIIDYKFEYENNQKIINELQKENKEKDKQIDLMIEEYEYNARINFKNFCEDELRKDNCIQDCKSCAKQYFEKLVKEKG